MGNRPTAMNILSVCFLPTPTLTLIHDATPCPAPNHSITLFDDIERHDVANGP